MDTLQAKGNTKKAYDQIAPTYLQWSQNSFSQRMSYLKLLTPLLAERKETHEATHILELGCGAGIPVTQSLASLGTVQITANDISSAQIDLAKKHLPPSVRLIQGDMMGLQFEPEEFDAVVAMYSIIHLPREEQTTMLERIFRWLKPGGLALMNFSAGEIVASSDPSWLGATEGSVFWSGWGEHQTRRILRDTGFELLQDDVAVDPEDGGDFLWVLAKKAA
ncbi:S-adenosyl-L-methionine-dependent methyltransferase [Aspergillus floccosus]